ncbi:MAG: SH3 domain-containing protein [Dehalococcoidia bacterium]|nr:SH3 domain-containing protein [Dehalococcoidia bacterium]
MGISPTRTALTLTALALLAVIAVQAPRPASAQSPESHPIVAAAMQRAGTYGGQCYTFVQDVVRDVTGRHIGMGYRQGFLSAGGIEIDPANARAGDVLQIANPNDTGSYYPGMHTVIVIENLGNRTYKVVDSNWQWNERVAVHNWHRASAPATSSSTPIASLSMTAAPTFRPGPVPAPPGRPELPRSSKPAMAPALSPAVASASVAALASATNILDCLSAGTAMTVLSGPTYADGYSWVQVELASGQRGWVASEFLESAPAPAPSEPEPTAAPTQAPDPTPDPGSGSQRQRPELRPGLRLATVDAPGSRLYLRGDSNLGGAIRDCLVHGTPLEILGEGGSADGYNWVHVELQFGSGSGWVASEHLAR